MAEQAMTGQAMAEQAVLAENPPRRGVGRAAWRFARPHGGAIIVAVVLGAVASLATTLGSVLVGRITDALLAGERQQVLALGIAGVALALIQLTLSAVSRAWLAAVGEHLVRDVRDTVAHRLAMASLRFIERHRAGELLQRSTAEVAALSAFVRESLTALLVTGSTVVIFVIVLATQSWILVLVLVAVFLPPSLYVMHRFRSRAAQAFGAEAQAEAEVAAELAESIRVRSLLAAAPEATREGSAVRAAALNGAAVEAQMRTVTLSRWISTTSLIEGATLVALIAIGSVLVGQALVTVGVVVTFVLASVTLFAGFSNLVALVGAVEEVLTGAARVNELIEATAPRAAGGHGTGRDGLAPAVPAPGSPAVELDGVWFGYGGEPVLRGLSMTIGAGTRCGLAGPSGAGKSTIATLIAGLYSPQAGSVRCCGVDLAGLSPRERSRLVSFVPQEVVLGSGTLADELRLAESGADDAALREAFASLGLGPWLERLPEGLATPLGADSTLSVGERQLVGLTRVTLRGSPVIVLDEATSDVDLSVAELVERALDQLAASRTVIVVAHRQTTLARLGTVYRIERGALAERAGSSDR